MNSKDKVSLLSQPTGSDPMGKINVKIMLLESNTHKYDHFGEKNTSAVQMDLSLDRKKHQGCNIVH